MISSKQCLPTFYLFGMNAAWFLWLIVVFLSFLVFLGVSDRAKMVANTTTFVAIMTKKSHDQQQTISSWYVSIAPKFPYPADVAMVLSFLSQIYM